MKRKSKDKMIADPLGRAEELLRQFEAEAGESLVAVNNAVGDKNIQRALTKAVEAHRRAYAFGHALSQATGESMYRVSAKPLRELKIQARSIIIPTAPLPDQAGKVLEALKTMAPPTKFFEGEAEYRQWLKNERMIEVNDDDHRSPDIPRWRELD